MSERPKRFNNKTTIVNVFNGQLDFGKKCTSTILTHDNYLSDAQLSITLPEINVNGVLACWKENIGELLIKNISVEIGNVEIQKMTGGDMHNMNQLNMTDDKRQGYNKLIGNIPSLTTFNNLLKFVFR